MLIAHCDYATSLHVRRSADRALDGLEASLPASCRAVVRDADLDPIILLGALRCALCCACCTLCTLCAVHAVCCPAVCCCTPHPAGWGGAGWAAPLGAGPRARGPPLGGAAWRSVPCCSDEPSTLYLAGPPSAFWEAWSAHPKLAATPLAALLPCWPPVQAAVPPWPRSQEPCAPACRSRRRRQCGPTALAGAPRRRWCCRRGRRRRPWWCRVRAATLSLRFLIHFVPLCIPYELPGALCSWHRVHARCVLAPPDAPLALVVPRWLASASGAPAHASS